MSSASGSERDSEMRDHSPAESVAPEEPSANLLFQLKHFIRDASHKATFACGGSIPILAADDVRARSPASGSSDGDTDAMASGPVALRWDAGEAPSQKAKLTFPLDDSTEGNLSELINAMQPAGFGMGGELVYDETYRKAGKMDPTAFSISFNPYEVGLVDTIAQVLLPNVQTADGSRCVRAELYKMNVYSGPSGKFKAHVDTPRSKSQFGSLVVCLPLEHGGGQLQVRHEGKEMTFDWSTTKQEPYHASIRWAAFYSDCEHEMLEVKSGHRLTLTYNLYAVRGTGYLGGSCPTLDPSGFPFSQLFESMLKDPQFMPEGGYLGFYCRHAYPHADAKSGLPDTLKGLDTVLWQTFKALGLNPIIRPVILADEYDYVEYYDGREQEKPDGYVASYLVPKWDTGRELRDGDEEGPSDLLKYWTSFDRQEHPEVKFDQITWLTKPKDQQEALQYISYGNEPCNVVRYSYCAIIVNVKGGRNGSDAAATAASETADAKQEKEEGTAA